MKIEFDVTKLTVAERRYIATVITNWPDQAPASTLQDILNAPKSDVFKAAYVAGATMGMGNTRLPELDKVITEEQRLDAEQKSDLEEVCEIGANLNAIFGAPIPQVPVDKEGLPWDHRIHASTKTFIADGTWKLKRGVDAAEVVMVKEQLKALMCVPTFVAVVNPDRVPFAPVISAPPAPPPPPAPTSHYLINQVPPTVTLTDLIARMSAAIVAGKMTQATVSEMCAKHGVSEFMLLSSRPDLLPLIDADMKAIGV